MCQTAESISAQEKEAHTECTERIKTWHMIELPGLLLLKIIVIIGNSDVTFWLCVTETYIC